METVIVASWEELQRELFAHSWNEDIGRFRSRYAFRGLEVEGANLWVRV
ncbi:hypothetical protein [Pelobacter propionicus]|nr:hypothetical protein [Pelobacter propionicus]